MSPSVSQLQIRLLLTESTLFFLNLTSNCIGRNPNFTLGGKVQNWISGVDKTSKPHEPATQTSNAVPPFTIFMHLTENTEITIESATSTGTGGKSGTVLVGGFDDEEPEDDSLERQVARSTDKKGREAVVICFFEIYFTLLIYFYRLPSH